MLKVIDVVYYSHSDIYKPQLVLNIHAPASGFAAFIKDRVDFQFVKHLNYEGTESMDGIKYSFFKSRNHFWYIPFKTHRYIKSQRPDIVIVEGLIFPVQLIVLKLQLGKQVRIIVQHHGEKPFTGIKKMFQRIADKCIDTYLFTSKENAKAWIHKKIIIIKDKCEEVLEASTYLTRQDKLKSQTNVGMNGSQNFLWVGRLDALKDPVTVLNAFERFAMSNLSAKLYMIYQSGNEIESVHKIIGQSLVLKDAVKLVGKVDHDKLADWYSAASFYISGSHREGSSYTLLEAMACGCIPVVTDIPSLRKMTADGNYGFLYPPGNVEALVEIFNVLQKTGINEYSLSVENYFNQHLSFRNIADDLYNIFTA
ncbi:MAG: glycosyltransferase family 4 protein [Ferruginibacter sp.]